MMAEICRNSNQRSDTMAEIRQNYQAKRKLDGKLIANFVHKNTRTHVTWYWVILEMKNEGVFNPWWTTTLKQIFLVIYNEGIKLFSYNSDHAYPPSVNGLEDNATFFSLPHQKIEYPEGWFWGFVCPNDAQIPCWAKTLLQDPLEEIHAVILSNITQKRNHLISLTFDGKLESKWFGSVGHQFVLLIISKMCSSLWNINKTTDFSSFFFRVDIV